MPAQELVLGTRGSALALAQTAIAMAALQKADPSAGIRVERIKTTGDIRTDLPLSELGRGIFVSEIESALQNGAIDLAVHSAKDLPSTLDPLFEIAAFLPRADPRDVLVAPGHTLASLPRGARVGTSSPRRACLLRALRPDLVPVEIRGNVDTRLRKLAEGEFDALLLAGAGLLRLGRASEASEWLDTATMIPCVGQGALALEARAGDEQVLSLLRLVDHSATRTAVSAERAFLAELGAGCRAAAAAHAHLDVHGRVTMHAFIGGSAGEHVRTKRLQTRETPEELGRSVARELLAAGGAAFLAPEQDPLRGKRIAITRPSEQSTELSSLLAAAGAVPVCFPTIAIELVDVTHDVASLGANCATWAAFTSVNAVQAVAQAMATVPAGFPGEMKLAAVGTSTARALSSCFRAPDFVARRSNADAMAADLPAGNTDTVVFFRGDLASDALASGLRQRGIAVTEVIAYKTSGGTGVSSLTQALREHRLDAVIFASPSSIRFSDGAIDLLRLRPSGRPLVICIGSTTAQAARSLDIVPDAVAVMQSADGLLESLRQAFTAERPPAS